MLTMKLFHVIILLCLGSIHGQFNIDTRCNSDDTVLYFDGQISESFEKMLGQYNQTCTPQECELQPSDPLKGFLNWNYGGVNFAMRSACPARRNFRACEVTTTVYHRFSEGGIEIRGYIVEENKGVCFPPSCSDEQVNLLDPEPGRCDPNTMDCEIVSYEVNCPSRQVSSSSTCGQDQLPPTSPFFIARGATELAIIADCTSLFSGGNSIGLCSATTGAIDASTKTDFTNFKTDSTYIDHENLCLEKGGQLCSFDMVADFTVPGAVLKEALNEVLPVSSAGDVTIRNEFIDFPRCLAPSCNKDSIEDVLAKHLNMFLGGFGLSCDLNSDSCNINLSNVQCKSKPATSAPTPFMPIKTKSPTPQPSVTKSTVPPTPQPSKAISATTNTPTQIVTSNPTQNKKSFSQPPSKLDSESLSSWPTLFPTLPSTDKPSVTPSFAPTEVLSDSPSVAPSFTPTEVLSDSPSVAPSFAPTEVLSDSPSVAPSFTPTEALSDSPSVIPSGVLSMSPSKDFSESPSLSPSTTNSANPSVNLFPSSLPSSSPTFSVSQTASTPQIGPNTLFSSGFSLSFGRNVMPLLLFWFVRFELM